MGLFDKVKKKNNEKVEATPIVEQASMEAAPVEGNQSVASQVSVDNNPFVEEPTPVGETIVNPTNDAPSFDNIFNAAPSDLIMPEQQPTVQPEIAVETALIPSFEVEESKEDMITQLVSENIAMPEQQVITPSTEAPNPETITMTINPVEEDIPLLNVEPMDSVEVIQPLSPVVEPQALVQSPMIEEQAIQSNQSPVENIAIEPQVEIISTEDGQLGVPEQIEVMSEPEEIVSPVMEQQVENQIVEQEIINPIGEQANFIDVVPETLDQPEVMNESVSEIIPQSEDILVAPTIEEQIIEPEQTIVENVVLEPQEQIINPEIAQSEVLSTIEPENSNVELQPTNENNILDQQSISAESVENLEDIAPVPETFDKPVETTVGEQTPTQDTVIENGDINQIDGSSEYIQEINQSVEIPTVEEVEVPVDSSEEIISLTDTPLSEIAENPLIDTPIMNNIETVSTTLPEVEANISEEGVSNTANIPVENPETTIDSNEENVSIEDINVSEEAFIPEEIAASTQTDIVELTSDPIVDDNQSETVIELSDEPVADITLNSTSLQDIELSGTPIEETDNEDTSESIKPENDENINQPVFENVEVPEITVPEIESTLEDSSIKNEDYYSNMDLVDSSIESEATEEENSSTEEAENADITEVNEESNQEIEESTEIKPIIEEESTDIVINVEDTEHQEESNESTEITPIIEEEEVSLNLGEEEPILPIVNESENSEIPKDEEESKEEMISLSTDENTDEEIETQENQEESSDEAEDIDVPDFDFQSFIMPTEDNNPDVEDPTVVEAQLDTATYISEPTTTKFCNNCGVMLTDDSSICPSCGEPID